MAPAETDDPRTTAPRSFEHGGRRWRTTDPAIPDRLRAELVAELMDARRAVAAGRRIGDEAAVRRARDRVQDAKVALGERGAPWWQPATPESLHERLAATMRALLRHRAPDSTICPSDAARVVGGVEWRSCMDEARSSAWALHEEHVVEVRSGGRPVPAAHALRGPLRIARGSAFPAA